MSDVMLLTKCGCSRVIGDPDSPVVRINLPNKDPVGIRHRPVRVADCMETRSFSWRGRRDGNMKIYEEE